MGHGGGREWVAMGTVCLEVSICKIYYISNHSGLSCGQPRRLQAGRFDLEASLWELGIHSKGIFADSSDSNYIFSKIISMSRTKEL